MPHASLDELDAGLDSVRAAPRELGTLELIVRRLAPGEREVLATGILDLGEALLGDRWKPKRASGGKPRDPGLQITVISSRMAALVAGGTDHERWAQADFDISRANLSDGSRFAIGSAVVEGQPDSAYALTANRRGIRTPERSARFCPDPSCR